MKFLVFDTETTGLPKRKNADPEETYLFPYIVQLSWMIFDSGVNKVLTLKDKIVSLPENIQIPQKAMEIHGITQERLREEGEHVCDVLQEFMNDVSGCTYLVGHNIDFDKNMVEVECIRNNCKRLSEHRKMSFCTMKEGKDVCRIERMNRFTRKKEFKFPKLIELHEHFFKTTPENLHNSLIDVLVCFRCCYKLIYNVDPIIVNKTFRNQYKLYCGL